MTLDTRKNVVWALCKNRMKSDVTYRWAKKHLERTQYLSHAQTLQEWSWIKENGFTRHGNRRIFHLEIILDGMTEGTPIAMLTYK